jgi:subtilisin family serine protease
VRRILVAVAIAVAVPAAWVGFERARGPVAGPLPAALPYCVRRPPALRASFPAPSAAPNPGDEVRRLHARGLTGKNVGIAIIDRFLLAGHREYADRLRWYDEIDSAPAEPAGWHATAVASIAAGRTVGVAPEADLYFVGLGMNWKGEPFGNLFFAARRAAHTGMPVALAIRRILEMNRRLEPGRKIRVISISIGGAPPEAIAEARRAGLFVSAADLRLAPMGPVTIASPAGPDAYTTHKRPAGSWAIAWWAGRYALACQEDPSMTPERFVKQIPAFALLR